MKNRKMWLATGMLVLMALTVPAVRSALAETLVSGKDLLKNVQVLGVGVVMSGSIKLTVIDPSDLTEAEVITLPTLSGNDGLMYMVKTTQGSSYPITIQPVSGQEIDSLQDGTKEIPTGIGTTITLVADTPNNTWWVIGTSSTD